MGMLVLLSLKGQGGLINLPAGTLVLPSLPAQWP